MRRVIRILRWAAPAVIVLGMGFVGFGLWSASDQLLSPSFVGAEKDLSVCKPVTESHWGPHCGNLRETSEFAFDEVQIPLHNNVNLPGWLITTRGNGKGTGKGAIVLVHAGGADRREMSRYIRFYLNDGFDVLTFDLECHGEAPCPVYGLSYGERECSDLVAAYSLLKKSHDKVFVMGTSVGAVAALIAIPNLPGVAGIIAENPYFNFDRLIREAKEAQRAPGFFLNGMIALAKWRGSFSGQQSPATVLSGSSARPPILFIHSKADQTVSFHQTEDLAAIYQGPKSVWNPERGSHAEIWDADKKAYQDHIAQFLGLDGE